MAEARLDITIEGSERSVVEVQYSPDDSLIASRDSIIRLWESSGKPIAALEQVPGIEFRPQGFAFLPDHSGSTITVVGPGPRVEGRVYATFFRGEPGRPVGDFSKWKWTNSVVPRASFDDNFGNFVYSPDGRMVALIRSYGLLDLVDISALKVKSTLSVSLPKRDLGCVAFSPDGSMIVGAGEKITIWDARTGQELYSINPTYHTSSLDFSSQGKTFAVGVGSSVEIWEVTYKVDKSLAAGDDLAPTPAPENAKPKTSDSASPKSPEVRFPGDKAGTKSTIADEIGDALATAKSKQTTAVVAAKANLTKAMEAAIKQAAVDARLDAVKVLLSAKDAFDTDEAIPALPELMPDVIAYVEARRIAAADLHKSYQEAVKNYTSKMLVTQASAVDAEMRKFVDAEKTAMSGKPKLAEKAPIKTKTTKDLLADFYIRYCEGMEKVEDQETSAKMEQVHTQVARKLDDSVKSQTWTLRCPVRDVQIKGRTFEIYFDSPEETPGFREKWIIRSSVSNLKLSKEQALDLKPGDTLILTGTPRFMVNEDTNDTAFFRRDGTDTGLGASGVISGSRGANANRHSHSIHLTNFKFSIEKSKKEVPEEKSR